MDELLEQLGRIDIYLFDQLQRGRIRRGMRLLDAGCGTGRNVRFFLIHGFDVSGADGDAAAIGRLREWAGRVAPNLPTDRFRCEPIESMGFDPASFDVVISNAVLHFAPDETKFLAMLDRMWRMVRPGGMLFVRLASSIGIEAQLHSLGGRRHRLPDGSDRFLVDEPYLAELESRLGGRRLDPLKTTVVDRQRSMSTWVLEKPADPSG
ncbi:MAG: class I SAM-dependent methyltransferase [Phycisphaeraceae bacterium]|nr:class I SAM-dependent methyltransferase [Phycisphaeraceae bacterium]